MRSLTDCGNHTSFLSLFTFWGNLMSNNKYKWFNTIRMKVILVVIASCTIVLGSLSIYTTISEQAALSNDLNTLAKVTTQRLSKHLIGPMWDLDKDLVEDIIEAEMLEDKIQAIIIWDVETSELFAARERAPDGSLVSSTGAITGDLIKASGIVNNGSQDIGEVTVFLSKKGLRENLQQSTIHGVVTLLVLILIMLFIITAVMNHLMIGPIKRLAKHADDISHGDLKQDIIAESNDEIGQLAVAFQRMQISLRVAFKRLHAKAT